MSPIIKVTGLSKLYHIGKKRSGSLRDAFRFSSGKLFSKGSTEEFWALKDVSFDVQQGEVLGVIGKNGAGKSTLLKILSRITEPTEGKVTISGRVSSLLEVGTGFHPELTGRENVFLNGAILGMKGAEVRKKFEEIVAFSGVETFIDTPVKHYSSGMYVRLAFAVAAHLEPEILIIDEVLAVGDAEFQKKCLGKMKDVSEHDGRTVIFVSHNIAAIQQLCHFAVWLKEGRLFLKDEVRIVVNEYMKTLRDIQWRNSFSVDTNTPKITFVELDEERMREKEFLLRIGFQSPFELKPPVPGFVLYNEIGAPVFGSNPRIHSEEFQRKELKEGIVSVSVKNISLYSGYYSISVWLGDLHTNYDYQDNAISFNYHSVNNYSVNPSPVVVGSVDPAGRWSIDAIE